MTTWNPVIDNTVSAWVGVVPHPVFTESIWDGGASVWDFPGLPLLSRWDLTNNASPYTDVPASSGTTWTPIPQ